MTNELLARACSTIYGPNWQRELARLLGGGDRTVRDWVARRDRPLPTTDAQWLTLSAELRRRAKAAEAIAAEIESGVADRKVARAILRGDVAPALASPTS